MRVLPRLTHRVHTQAPISTVWRLVADPGAWHRIDPLVSRIEGANGQATQGQHLLAVGRPIGLRVPVDVRDVEPAQRLGLTVRTLPGLTEHLDHILVASVGGGTDIVVNARLEGPLARFAAVPTWVLTGVSSRLLARESTRAYKRMIRRAQGVA